MDKVLNKTNEVKSIEKFDDTIILIETDDKFPDDITLKYVVILITCVIKIGGKFYPQLFSEEALVA